MRNIEIPYVEERGRRYRFFEMLPGLLTWTILALPFALSFVTVSFARAKAPLSALLILAYLLLWFVKSMGLTVRSLQGFRIMDQHRKLPWGQMLNELQTGVVDQPDRHIPTWHYENLKRITEDPVPIKPENVLHAIIIATYNEAREVLEPTILSVLDSDYDMNRVILVLAYEERGGPEVEAQAEQLIKDYRTRFHHAMAVKHPKDLPGEVIGKGGNITYAGRALERYLEKEGIEPLNVLVTTLDADNRPHQQYLNALSYVYSLTPNPLHVSFQPIPVFTNNIWDVPAPMRVIATGNTFWNVVLSLRPHMIRNFSSHTQSMQTLIDTDYWSVRTIVEDGHQFWRTYFRYDGNHEVFPIYLPIYQDAVLSNTYWKTLKAQFIQLRRWAWGASDIAYVAELGYFKPNKVPKVDLTFKFLRLLEGHVSWATAPLILAFSAFVPALFRFNSNSFASNQLPILASRIQTIALAGILVTLFLSLKLLPPKPKRYKSHRTLFMVFQWVLLPVTTVVFNSFAALYSQTRLLIGKYLGKFDVTEKAVITEDKQKIM
jgi:hypothetical protein